jgi:ketosteroid isomerase-like protein
MFSAAKSPRTALSLFLCISLFVCSISRGEDSSRIHLIDTIKTFAHSWETGDLAAFTSTLDDRLLWAHPGGTLDKRGAIAFFQKWQKEWLNTRIYPTTFIVEGDRILAEYQFCSTNRQTGKREAEGTAAIGQVKNGKIVLWKEYYDHSVGELQSRGAIPVDEGEPSFPYPRSAKNRW